jgi:hypothetical protein
VTNWDLSLAWDLSWAEGVGSDGIRPGWYAVRARVRGRDQSNAMPQDTELPYPEEHELTFWPIPGPIEPALLHGPDRIGEYWLSESPM